jgi:hypothetical protein
VAVAPVRRGHPLSAMKRLSSRSFLNAGHVDVSLAGKTLPSYDLFLASRGLSRNLVATVNHYSAGCTRPWSIRSPGPAEGAGEPDTMKKRKRCVSRSSIVAPVTAA